MSALEQTYPDAGPAPGRKERLVVVGNGMAGARTVEEILARGGAEQFDITMFGDEPYGNYNRILLSHVLSGQETDDDIFLNTIDWYEENDITLYAGVRVTRVDRFAKVVFSDDGRVTPSTTSTARRSSWAAACSASRRPEGCSATGSTSRSSTPRNT
jgi:nitrite reductase (NADH) large subunit